MIVAVVITVSLWILSERAAFTGHRRRDAALLGALAGEDSGDDPWPALTCWLRVPAWRSGNVGTGC